MSTSVSVHQVAVTANGFLSVDRDSGLLDRCQLSWAHQAAPPRPACLIQTVALIRPLASLAWGLFLLAILPRFIAEAFASSFLESPDFSINNYTTGNQNFPDVESLPGGGFITTWSGEGRGGVGFEIYGRISDAVGRASDSDFLINTYSGGNQYSPSVARLSDSGFVVIWYGVGQGSISDDIYGRRYDALGMAVAPGFLVNLYTVGDQRYPSVAALAGGGFIVAWSGGGESGSGDDIYGRRYDALGVAVGSDFPINTYTAGTQRYPSVAALAGGGFVVTWFGEGESGSGDDIYGRRYDALGVAVGSDFPVNTYTAGTQQFPKVAALSDGGFVVVWQGVGQGGSLDDVYGHRYDVTGADLGSDFLINTLTNGQQRSPSVAGHFNGSFLVVWYNGPVHDIHGRFYGTSGIAKDPEFPINTYTAGTQRHPSIAALSGGRFVVIWSGAGEDGSGNDIYGHILTANTSGTWPSPATSTSGILTTMAAGATSVTPIAPQPGVDPHRPDLAVGIGVGVAALVCSLLSALGLVLMRRKRIGEFALSQGASGRKGTEPNDEQVPATSAGGGVYQRIELRDGSYSIPSRSGYEMPHDSLDSSHSYEMPHIPLDQEEAGE